MKRKRIQLPKGFVISYYLIPRKFKQGIVSHFAKIYGVSRQAIHSKIKRELFKLRHSDAEIVYHFMCKNGHKWNKIKSQMETKDKFCPICFERGKIITKRIISN